MNGGDAFPILTLQPDSAGRLNVSRYALRGRELVREALSSGSCTADRPLAGAGRMPYLARDRVVPNKTETAAAASGLNSFREGPTVLPFVRHLLGQGQGAFCGDCTIYPAISAETILPYDVVRITGINSKLGVPTISLTGTAYAYAVCRGVIEDSARRTYVGNTSPDASGTLYCIQLFGLCDVYVSDSIATVPSFGDALYVSGRKAVQSSDDFLGTCFGLPRSVTLPDGTSRVICQMYMMSSGGGETSYPFKVSVFSLTVDEVTTWYAYMAKGYLQVIGSEPLATEIAEESSLELPNAATASVYRVWTYSTADTSGSWGEITIGTPPAESGLQHVVVFADLERSGTGSDEDPYVWTVLMQRQRTDIAVLDILSCVLCTTTTTTTTTGA